MVVELTATAPHLHHEQHTLGQQQQRRRGGRRLAGQVDLLTLEPHIGSGGVSARVLNLTGQVRGSDAAASLV
jgi:hypothetical protein